MCVCVCGVRGGHNEGRSGSCMFVMLAGASECDALNKRGTEEAKQCATGLFPSARDMRPTRFRMCVHILGSKEEAIGCITFKRDAPKLCNGRRAKF